MQSQIQNNTARRTDVACPVIARPAINVVGAGVARENVVTFLAPQLVAAAAAGHDIVAIIALDDIGVVVAAEEIAMEGAEQVLDKVVAIALCVAGIRPGKDEVDDDPGGSVPVIGVVAALAAIDDIGALAADQVIVAVISSQDVVAVPARNRVVA